MTKKIKSALISVYYKAGLEPLVNELHLLGVRIYSTGGTQKFIEDMGISVTPVETLTGYPSILGGRVKTLHPGVFGGILGRRHLQSDIEEMAEHQIPEIDLVIVDLYPFEETLATTNDEDQIIEKIDIGGPSLIRAAAKNYKDVAVIAARKDYSALLEVLTAQNGCTTVAQRKDFAATAFNVVAQYDIAISQYFSGAAPAFQPQGQGQALRYGENPHQQAVFYGNANELFEQLNGKALSYNNLVDVDAAIRLIGEFGSPAAGQPVVFAIIKHTNVCGVAEAPSMTEAWEKALAGDPESAFGGVLVTNATIDEPTARNINELFFEVLIAPAFDEKALQMLKSKKNRILLQANSFPNGKKQFRSVLNGMLEQSIDEENFTDWKEAGGRNASDDEKENLAFANLICKHLKSNAIALVKNKQLVGKGCGQTSRVDALRQAIEKARQSGFSLHGAVMASDAFFPFDDCVQLGHTAGIEAFIQPGGSIRDKDSAEYCIRHGLAMVMTGIRHFKH